MLGIQAVHLRVSLQYRHSSACGIARGNPRGKAFVKLSQWCWSTEVVLNCSCVGSYGYRGRDARCNVYQLPTGEIVYFVAAVVLLYNADEQMQRHYVGHTDDIKWYWQQQLL